MRTVHVRVGHADDAVIAQLAFVEFIADAAAEGVRDVLLCGSGSAVFAPCESYEAAQALVARASLQGYWARATTFSGIRAAVMPARR